MIDTCKTWLDDRRDFILITIAEIAGSSPRGTDTSMAVSIQGTVGTIGGGRLEWDAIAHARSMLLSGQATSRRTITLGPETGQCCGGKVTLQFNQGSTDRIADLVARDATERAQRPVVYLFGAGHVGRALANALAPLPFQVHLIDSRAGELDQCRARNVQKNRTDSPISIAETAQVNAAHVIMTHSHSLDSLIAGAILEKGRFCYLGIIGSKTKRASFHHAFKAMGISEEMIARVVCPIGSNAVLDKRPEVIAALTAAEIIQAVLS